MAFTNQTLQVACRGVIGSEVWANIWCVEHPATDPGIPLPAAHIALVANLFDEFYEDLQAHFHTSWALEEIAIRQLDELGNGPYSFAGTVVGTETTSVLPYQDAVVLSLRTGLAGRSFRGRIFLGGFTEAALTATGPRLLAAVRDAIGNAALTLENALLALTPAAGIAVYSRKLEEATLCSQFKVGTVLDTQTRRRNRLSESYVSYTP